MAKSVLMVVTSLDKLANGQPTGFWLEELAASYWVFADAGCGIDIASPRGGAAPIDPASKEDPWISAHGHRFLQDNTAMNKLANTLSTADCSADLYDTLFVVGGIGAAFDLYGNPSVTRLIETFDRQNKTVSAVCTGAVALAGAQTRSGQSLVAGRTVTGISNAENDALQLTPILPVLTENRLKSAGADYKSAAEPWGVCVQVDGNIFTGQNPASAGPLAKRIVKPN